MVAMAAVSIAMDVDAKGFFVLENLVFIRRNDVGVFFESARAAHEESHDAKSNKGIAQECRMPQRKLPGCFVWGWMPNR
jgi:hypothetical protein